MYKRFFSSYYIIFTNYYNTYKRPAKRTIPSSYRVPDVLRRDRRNNYCKSTTPYYGGEGGGMGYGRWDVGGGGGDTRRGDTTISVPI